MRVVVGCQQGAEQLLVELVASERNDIEVVGAAANGPEAAGTCARLQPDVAVLELPLASINGIELIGVLRATSPGTQVVLWSGDGSPRAFAEALRHGAAGCVSRAAGITALLDEVERVARPVAAEVEAPAGGAAAQPWVHAGRQGITASGA